MRRHRRGDNCSMDLNLASPLLGGMSPALFMRRHWQRKPLVARGAWPAVKPPLARAELFALAAQEDVESRLVRRDGMRWSLRRGPLPRRSLPRLRQPDWTLLVQGVDLHADAARSMLNPFRFVPDARLDDLMISFATAGGGVGPHVDPYDVFLVQLQGRRRWRIGPVRDQRLVEGAPLKLLRHFVATEEFVLDPGDLLYLPPIWGHDGVALGECMTASVGFRTPSRHTIVREVLPHLIDALPESPSWATLYRDAGAPASPAPARIPASMQRFAKASWQRILGERGRLAQALGQWLTEPKPEVWFEQGAPLRVPPRGLRLDRRSRMMYDGERLYINGEVVETRSADTRLMRQLADRRELSSVEHRRLTTVARDLVNQWAEAGWLHEC